METSQKIMLRFERLIPSVAKLILLLLAASSAALLLWPIFRFATNVYSSRTAGIIYGGMLLIVGLLFAIWLWFLPKPELRHFKTRRGTVAEIWRGLTEEICSDLSQHPTLPSLRLPDAAQHYDSWHGEDLWRFTRDYLAPDPHPIARIHHAAALFSLGLRDAACDVLRHATQPERLLPIAIAQTDLLELQGQLLTAAGLYRDLRREIILPIDLEQLLTAKELELRVRAGDLELARRRISKLLDQTLDLARRAFIHELLAEIPLADDCPAFLPDALEHIDKAIGLQPSEPRLKRTKGALLYELLQRDEAEKWLRASLAETIEPEDIAVCHFYLALIERKRGHLLESQRLARKIPAPRIPQWLIPRLKFL